MVERRAESICRNPLAARSSTGAGTRYWISDATECAVTPWAGNSPSGDLVLGTIATRCRVSGTDAGQKYYLLDRLGHHRGLCGPAYWHLRYFHRARTDAPARTSGPAPCRVFDVHGELWSFLCRTCRRAPSISRYDKGYRQRSIRRKYLLVLCANHRRRM